MKSKKSPLVTIITSSWNREKYLRKLTKSLEKQTFKNFEWIIANDGSTDNTEKFIRSFAKKVNFKIIFINSTLRVGKSKLVNLMYKRISGKFMIECDSDDYFLPNALNDLVKLTKDVPKNNKNFAGIFAQNVDTKKISQTFKKSVPKKNIFLNWRDLQNITDGDGSIFAFSKNFINKKYKEVDFLITESSLLNKIFKNKFFLLTPRIVKIMNRGAENSVSFGNKMRYTRASAYSIGLSETKKIFNNRNFFSRIKLILNYWRYTLHGDIKYAKAQKIFPIINKNILYKFIYIFSYFIYLRDILINKVEKTHLEFEKNIKKTKIDIVVL